MAQDNGKRNLDLLMNVSLEVTAELGKCKMMVADILKLGTGSVVELDRLAGGPVDLLVNEQARRSRRSRRNRRKFRRPRYRDHRKAAVARSRRGNVARLSSGHGRSPRFDCACRPLIAPARHRGWPSLAFDCALRTGLDDLVRPDRRRPFARALGDRCDLFAAEHRPDRSRSDPHVRHHVADDRPHRRAMRSSRMPTVESRNPHS